MSNAGSPEQLTHDADRDDRVMRGTWREHVLAAVEHSGQALPFVAACLVDILATTPTTRTRHPGSAEFRELVNEELIGYTGHPLTRGDLRRGLEELKRRNLLPTWIARSADAGRPHSAQRPARACEVW